MHLAIIDGPAWQRWNPDTALAGGAGGAQMALVDLPPRLHRRGWNVTVFADCQGLEGTFDGVRWLDYRKFAHGNADVLMVWRQPAALAMPFRARRTLFMARDVHYGDAISPATAAAVDCFAVLSAWHRGEWERRYPFTAGRVWQTRNGVDLQRYVRRHEIPRQRLRAVYTSAPYRGLDMALATWPLLRQRVPEAELHVYYGFRTSDRLAARTDDGNLAQRLEQARRLLENSPGVCYHGGRGRREIDDALMAADTWFYPCTFFETSCAAAMEAQCAGCHVISNPLGALKETIACGDLVTDRSPREYARRLAARMFGTAGGADPAVSAPPSLLEQFDIEPLADQWHERLSTLLSSGAPGAGT